MSYLLETLGRGLLGQLQDAFRRHLPDCDDLVPTLEKRVGDSPTSVDLNLRLATAKLRDMRLRDARTGFTAALQLDPQSRAAAIGLACVCDELGDLEGAQRHLRRAQQLDPEDPAIAFALGMCHERVGEPVDAEVHYQRSIDLCDTLQNAHERIAAIAVQRCNWPAAAERYRRLLAIAPENLDIGVTLATLDLHAGNFERAIEGYQRALLIEPEAAADELECVEHLETEGKLRHAIQTLESLVGKYPGVCEFRIHLGDLYVKAGEDQRAVGEYQAAIELHPGFLEAMVKLGTQHLRAGRCGDAAQTFVRAVELNDRLLTTFVGLGVAQAAAKLEREALATFDLAASLAPNSTLLLSETTRLYLQSRVDATRADGLHDDDDDEPPVRTQEHLLHEALRRHRDALTSHPMQSDLHYRYGMLAQQMGDFAGATQAFHAAVSITPTYTKALIKLGVSLHNEGHIAPAVEAFRRAMLLRPDDLAMHYHLALLFAQRNRFDIAIDQFDALTEGESRQPSLQQNIGLALQNVGMVDRASATWQAICDVCVDDSPMTSSRVSSRFCDRWS
ncbi:MAG: tetratricopeptide repeat protein [Phycisphaerae bacterium]